jgi:hypothetical protein
VKVKERKFNPIFDILLDYEKYICVARSKNISVAKVAAIKECPLAFPYSVEQLISLISIVGSTQKGRG